MSVIDVSNSAFLVFFLIVHEFLFRRLECCRDKRNMAKWVNEGYPPLAPQNFNKNWFGDIRYYALLIILLLYSYLHNNDLLTLLIINVYLTVNSISHLIGRWFTIIKFISQLRINGRGANIINNQNNFKNWKRMQLLGVRKWINCKFDILNTEIFKGIKMCKENKAEGLFHLNRIDINFLQQDFIISPLQAFYANCIFWGHILAIVVINAILLYNMSKSGMIEMSSIEYGIDALYSVLQIISTVGFGDIAEKSYSTLALFHLQCFFIIMFVQVVVTIILGVAYKNSALTVANEIFDKLSQNFNEKIQNHKNLCIEAVITGTPSDYLKEDIENDYYDLGRPAYSLMINELKEYIKTSKQPPLKQERVKSFKGTLKRLLLGWI